MRVRVRIIPGRNTCRGRCRPVSKFSSAGVSRCQNFFRQVSAGVKIFFGRCRQVVGIAVAIAGNHTHKRTYPSAHRRAHTQRAIVCRTKEMHLGLMDNGLHIVKYSPYQHSRYCGLGKSSRNNPDGFCQKLLYDRNMIAPIAQFTRASIRLKELHLLSNSIVRNSHFSHLIDSAEQHKNLWHKVCWNSNHQIHHTVRIGLAV